MITAPVLAQGVDWNKIGRPMGNDTTDIYDRYVYFDETKTADPNVSLAKPLLSRSAIAIWAMDRVPQVMTLSSQNYRDELKQDKPYFTDKGLRAFIQFLEGEGFIKNLQQNHSGMSVIVKFTPDVLADAVFNDVYRWNIDVPVMVSYLGGNLPTREFTINLDVVRVAFGKNSDGLAFDFWEIKKPDDKIKKPSADTNQVDDALEDTYQ